MSVEEIRGRLPVPPPLKAEHVASDEDGWLYASITHDHTLRDGTVCNQHLATVDSDEEDAEFIAHAPEDMRRLLNAVEAVGKRLAQWEERFTGMASDEVAMRAAIYLIRQDIRSALEAKP